MPSKEQAIADTRRWLERAVIGLQLCPFAKAVYVKDQVHLAVCESDDENAMLEALDAEAGELLALPAEVRDTTLLLLPVGMEDFLRFHALVGRAERLLRKRGLEGELQLASFHPRFVFSGAGDDELANLTNRSPHPTLHLLREESIERAVAAYPDPAAIYERNIATLEALGAEGWRALGIGAPA
jgi:hypothetical protein